jgi:hypothetical protein
MQTQFSGTLTAAQVKHHIPHHFVVPENCQRLHIHLRYEPPQVGRLRNMMTLTLFDPNGFRGAGHRHGNSHEITLTPSTATPGYYPGPLPAGEWTVQIDTHMILPGANCPYTLTVTAESEDAVIDAMPAAPARFDFVANPDPGWYRGDIHAHTLHSDASWDVSELVDAARRIGLDFVTLTDHNTTSPLPEMASYSTPDLLTMGGMELTTFWGHAVCLGTMNWIDWRVDAVGEGMARIAEAQTAAGALFIIAHPNDQGDPVCTGCRWVYPHMQPGPARLVEVWNGRWESTDPASKNEGSLNLWYRWLNQGYRLAATAGTDAHGPAPLDGVGFNTVYARELSQAAILEGLAAGRNYLSAGPILSFSAQNEDGEIALIGGDLPACGEITLQCAWDDAPAGASLRLVRNGAVIHEQPILMSGSTEWSFPSEASQWFVLELRREDGWMAALTNPIATI